MQTSAHSRVYLMFSEIDLLAEHLPSWQLQVDQNQQCLVQPSTAALQVVASLPARTYVTKYIDGKRTRTKTGTKMTKGESLDRARASKAKKRGKSTNEAIVGVSVAALSHVAATSKVRLKLPTLDRVRSGKKLCRLWSNAAPRTMRAGRG